MAKKYIPLFKPSLKGDGLYSQITTIIALPLIYLSTGLLLHWLWLGTAFNGTGLWNWTIVLAWPGVWVFQVVVPIIGFIGAVILSIFLAFFLAVPAWIIVVTWLVIAGLFRRKESTEE